MYGLVVLLSISANQLFTVKGITLSEDLKGAIVGAVLTFVLTCLFEVFKKVPGRVKVITERYAKQIIKDKEGKVEKIEIHANMLCENHKRELVSLYAWYAILHTNCGTYKVQLSNLCSDGEYKFLDVVSLNQYQSAQFILNGTIDLKRIDVFRESDADFMGYRNIENVQKIENVEIQYRSSRKKGILIAENKN